MLFICLYFPIIYWIPAWRVQKLLEVQIVVAAATLLGILGWAVSVGAILLIKRLILTADRQMEEVLVILSPLRSNSPKLKLDSESSKVSPAWQEPTLEDQNEYRIGRVTDELDTPRLQQLPLSFSRSLSLLWLVFSPPQHSHKFMESSNGILLSLFKWCRRQTIQPSAELLHSSQG